MLNKVNEEREFLDLDKLNVENDDYSDKYLLGKLKEIRTLISMLHENCFKSIYVIENNPKMKDLSNKIEELEGLKNLCETYMDNINLFLKEYDNFKRQNITTENPSYQKWAKNTSAYLYYIEKDYIKIENKLYPFIKEIVDTNEDIENE